MAQTTRIDYEIAASKVNSLIVLLMEDLRQCQAVWQDMESIKMIDNISDKFTEMHDYFLEQI